MENCRCNCWFPIYFIVSIVLGVIAISSAVHSRKSAAQEQLPTIPYGLSINASDALRSAGYIVMSDLLRRTPPFLRPPNNSTIFAIKDSAIRNTSLPPWLFKNLLLYHTITSAYSMQDLLNMTQGTCITTLYREKSVAITKLDKKQRTLEINHVQVSSPDIFLGESLTIHGVAAPFVPLMRREDRSQWGLDTNVFFQTPTCRVANASSSYGSKNNNAVEWNRIVQFLGSKGYSSFSIALHSVLDGLQKDTVSLSSATIFAPSDMGLLGYPSDMLDRAVRLHILPKRLTHKELSSMPVRTLLRTLMPDEDLEIDGVLGFMRGVVISGVEIVAPDMLSSERFIVHGISTTFKIAELTG